MCRKTAVSYYFTQGNRLWEYDLIEHQLSESITFDTPITGLELEDGHLYITAQNETLRTVDTATFAYRAVMKTN